MEIIRDYLTELDCMQISGGNNFACENREYSEECYSLANRRCNSEFSENCNYGGCDSEDEFWEQLFN